MPQNKKSLDQFYQNSDLTPEKAVKHVQKGLAGTDYGEFYQELTASESITKDKGIYVNISAGNSTGGFGFRAGQQDRAGYSYSALFNEKSLQDAISQARQVLHGHSGLQNTNYGQTKQRFYKKGSPFGKDDLAKKIQKIDDIESHVMGLDPNIENVTISYSAGKKDIHIITADGQDLVDERPNTMLSIGITLKGTDDKTVTGTALAGGRVHYKDVFNKTTYEAAAQKALNQARQLLIAKPAPAGQMDVVLSAGWPAVLLHEAVGHGLEGDFNRRGISVYSGKIGQQVAAPGVTIVDQGNMPGERGSIHFDDEGTLPQRNVLVEDGVLKGYMQDRQNAALMNTPLTGNGRRQSYTHMPMPRMTNTFFEAGQYEPDEIIASVKDGLYISDMGGGQVDITSGKFTMKATLAYRIRDGQLCEPVEGATLIGKGLDVIQSIKMIGNDLTLEKSAGSCGKNGQTVPVSCGQPTLRVANMTVGGQK